VQDVKRSTQTTYRPLHYHCPAGCEHPQPYLDEYLGKWLCGLCRFFHNRITEMVVCTPEVCDESVSNG
jgi:hypothetical protein